MAEKNRTILGKIGFTPKGDWQAGTTYDRLDFVSMGGSSFLSLSNGNNALLTDATKWMALCRKGDKGDPLTFDDLTEEQKAKLRGEKGDPFRYEDFTQEQLSGLHGHSPDLREGIWWKYDDTIGDYVNTGVSANSEFELTKPKVENVLTGDITTHNHATQLAEALASYVRAVAGKQLSTEDFTTALKNKLVGLENYNDSAVVASIGTINQRIDTLLGSSASSAIDTFNEITAFLAGITDTQSLATLLSDLRSDIVALIPIKTSQLTNDSNFVSDPNYVHTDNNYSTTEKNKLSGIAANANNYSLPAATDSALGGIKTGYTTAQKNYPVKLDVNKNAYVNVPWLDSPATQSANGLMLASDKKKLDRIGSYTTATTVASLNANYEKIEISNLSANASLSVNLTGTAYNGWEILVAIYCSSARTITIPTTGNYISMIGSSLTCPAGKWTELHLVCIGGKWRIAKLEQE